MRPLQECTMLMHEMHSSKPYTRQPSIYRWKRLMLNYTITTVQPSRDAFSKNPTRSTATGKERHIKYICNNARTLHEGHIIRRKKRRKYHVVGTRQVAKQKPLKYVRKLVNIFYFHRNSERQRQQIRNVTKLKLTNLFAMCNQTSLTVVS